MPSTDPGDRIYAIGDLHGRHDLLRLLLERIGAHARALPPARATYVVLLGDLVDRGPASVEVLETLFELQRGNPLLTVLLGNHEEMMLEALGGDEGVMRRWLALGGTSTLRSFGIEPPRQGDDLRETLRQLRAAVPRVWVAWLRKLPLSVRSGDYYFVHAGIRPGVPLHRQARADMLWIREEFLDDPRTHGAVIVHGHTISAEVEIRPNRIGVDTGAYRTGRLSAIYLDGDRQEVLTATLPAGAGVGA